MCVCARNAIHSGAVRAGPPGRVQHSGRVLTCRKRSGSRFASASGSDQRSLVPTRHDHARLGRTLPEPQASAAAYGSTERPGKDGRWPMAKGRWPPRMTNAQPRRSGFNLEGPSSPGPGPTLSHRPSDIGHPRPRIARSHPALARGALIPRQGEELELGIGIGRRSPEAQARHLAPRSARRSSRAGGT